jgi:hypothetical protein
MDKKHSLYEAHHTTSGLVGKPFFVISGTYFGYQKSRERKAEGGNSRFLALRCILRWAGRTCRFRTQSIFELKAWINKKMKAAGMLGREWGEEFAL